MKTGRIIHLLVKIFAIQSCLSVGKAEIPGRGTATFWSELSWQNYLSWWQFDWAPKYSSFPQFLTSDLTALRPNNGEYEKLQLHQSPWNAKKRACCEWRNHNLNQNHTSRPYHITNPTYLDLPRGCWIEIRGAERHHSSFGFKTAMFGRCWYKSVFFGCTSP